MINNETDLKIKTIIPNTKEKYNYQLLENASSIYNSL